MNLEQELSDWGPVALDSLENPPSLELAQKYCRSLARSHYENFVVVGLFTPPHLKQSFEAIYGFCRWADDLGDETGDPHRVLLAFGAGFLRTFLDFFSGSF